MTDTEPCPQGRTDYEACFAPFRYCPVKGCGRTEASQETTHQVRAQALVEAVVEYELAHPKGAPCFSEALALMRQVCEP